jgi:hypothetical protein
MCSKEKLIMKRMLFLICAGALITVTSCRKKDAITSSNQIGVSSGKISFKIPPLASGTEYGLAMVKHRLNLDSLAMGVKAFYNKSNVSSVSLNTCILYMENETNALSLGNFKSIKIEALTSQNILAGSLSSIKDTPQYMLTIPGFSKENLVSSVVKDTITYRIGGVTQKAIGDTLYCTAEFTYYINVSGK